MVRPNSEKVKIKIFDSTGSIYCEFMVVLDNYPRDELQAKLIAALNDYTKKTAPKSLPLPNRSVGNFSRFWDGISRNAQRVIRELHRETGQVSFYTP